MLNVSLWQENIIIISNHMQMLYLKTQVYKVVSKS